MELKVEKCYIVEYFLGTHRWFLVEQNGLVLSTPIRSFKEALTWISSMTGSKVLDYNHVSTYLSTVSF